MASLALHRNVMRFEDAPATATDTAVTLRICSWRELADPPVLEAWDRLASHAAEPNPFLESWYLLPSLEQFDPDETSRIVTLWRGGDLLGLLPLGQDKRYAGRPIPCMATWSHPNIFCAAPLVAKGSERDFWLALLDWADAQAKSALFLHLTHLPADGPVYAALKDLIGETDRPAAVVMEEERALLRSDLSPQDYFVNSMSGKKRKELRRQSNRLAEEGTVRFEREDGSAGIEQWIDDFLTLEQGGWKGKGGSALTCDRRTRTLFRKALLAGAERGRLERLAVYLDDRPIAMLANFIAAPGAFSFKTAFDEGFARFSPGVLIQRENLDLLSRPRIEWCDSCAAADHPMIERIWREKRRVVRVSIGIGGPLRRFLFRLIARAETGAPPKGLT